MQSLSKMGFDGRGTKSLAKPDDYRTIIEL